MSMDCNSDIKAPNHASHTVSVKDTVSSDIHQQDVAKVVVRVLSPYYANQQIASKVIDND